LPDGAAVVIPAGVETVQYGAFGLYTNPPVTLTLQNPDTHLETASEYAARTGESWVLEGD